jgi:hypothetical protein
MKHENKLIFISSKARNVMETAVALTESFVTRTVQHRAFYGHFKDDVCGFPGVWGVLCDASVIFEEEVNGIFDGYFPEAIDRYAHLLLGIRKTPRNRNPLDMEKLRKVARRAIRPYRSNIIPDKRSLKR